MQQSRSAGVVQAEADLCPVLLSLRDATECGLCRRGFGLFAYKGNCVAWYVHLVLILVLAYFAYFFCSGKVMCDKCIVDKNDKKNVNKV